ncbi:DinB superfamily protein [compost metagenome]
MDLEQRRLWNENHKKLTGIILDPLRHTNTIELFLLQHAWLYSSRLGNTPITTLEDELFKGMREETLRQYPVACPDTRNSIIWHIWHITRIEDMTMNILVNHDQQVLFSGNRYKELNVRFTHSGNDMSEEEIAELSSNMDINALLSYRLEVGLRTRQIIQSLQPGHFKQKVDPDLLRELVDQGAVKEDSNWLIEYWGKKNIAGLILMPATRHHFLHLNKSIRIKKRIQK